jgi:lysine 2,3-aminomutase
VCDAPGGGGKRTIHSFEHYDRETGVSVFTSPAVKTGYFLYFDPLDLLPPESQRRWRVAAEQQRMIEAAVTAARANMRAHGMASAIDTSDAEGPIHC